MIDWVDWKLRAWGRAKWFNIISNSYPPSSLGKIIDLGPAAAAATVFQQHFAEGMTGDALECSKAIHLAMMARPAHITDRQYEAIFVLYACKGYSVREKARAMEISTKNLYALRDRAHENLEPILKNLQRPVNDSPP